MRISSETNRLTPASGMFQVRPHSSRLRAASAVEMAPRTAHSGGTAAHIAQVVGVGPRGGAAVVGLGGGPLAAPGRREMVPTPVAVIDLADALPVLPQPMQLSTKNDLGRRTTDHPIRSKHGLFS